MSDLPESEPLDLTEVAAAQGVVRAMALIGGRWKLEILFHLFGGRVKRFSDLERAIPGVSPKMLAQQLRRMEADGMVLRRVLAEVPPRVEYRLTAWGQSLCPALDALLRWGAMQPQDARIISVEEP